MLHFRPVHETAGSSLDEGPLSFEDNSFDDIVYISALEFMPDLGMILREAYHGLNPCGKLVVRIIGRNSRWGRFYAKQVC
ncbi:class I SAM-dependent methyltransferase [Desulfofundulus sp.]|uniref:class I SAM-dependent methyltransferase n=1 Tax=Desulfofundulus sp. TaxID=2282750 RepID=UPI003C7928C5